MPKICHPARLIRHIYIHRWSFSLAITTPEHLSKISEPVQYLNEHIIMSQIVSAFERADLIPDVIPPSVSFQPSVDFSVVYSGGKEAILASEIVREDTLEEPEIYFREPGGLGGENVRYTLVMSDPDAPSRADPKYGQVRHLLFSGH